MGTRSGTYNYTATKGADGKFSVNVYCGPENVGSTDGLRNAKTARAWAMVAANNHKINNLAPEVHGEQHTVFGSFEL